MDTSLTTIPSRQIDPANKPDLSPALRLQHLSPYKTIEVLDTKGVITIYSFLRLGCAPTSTRWALSDPSIARQFATVTIRRDSPTFTFSFWPKTGEGEIQIVKDLPVSRIEDCVDDLINAGFAPPRKDQSASHSNTTIYETPVKPAGLLV